MILMVGEIPIQQIRELILLARQKNVMIIGPTVVSKYIRYLLTVFSFSISLLLFV